MVPLRYKFWVHPVFWILYISLVTLVSGSINSFPLQYYFIHELINLPVYMLVAYYIVYYLVPANLEKKLWPLYLTMMLFIVVAGAVICQLIEHFIYFRFILSKVFEPDNWMGYNRVLGNVWVISIPTIIVAARKFYVDWQKSKKEKEVVEKLQLKTELQMLRLQLNPHFLFNTLNNLYYLTIAKNDKAPEVVSKLSEILRFLIYDSNTQMVSLKSEIQLIENYIDLELLRYNERMNQSFEVNGNAQSVMIPPLLLFTFVENSFKHGVSNDSGNPEIHIELAIKDTFIHFKIQNTIPKKITEEDDKPGGIGLVNLRKRLELIYPNRHKLEIDSNEQLYMVDLKLYTES